MTPEAKRRTWRDTMLRGAILGVVLALHLVVLGFLWLWVADSSYGLQSGVQVPARVLHVTLLDDSPATTLPPSSPPPRRQGTWTVVHSARSKPQTTAQSVAAPVRESLVFTPMPDNPAPAASVQRPAIFQEAFERRIRRFTRGDGLQRKLPRLSGHSHYRTRFVFVDPKTRGLQGAMRVIAGMTTPPSCIESRAYLHPNAVDPLVIGEDKRAEECRQADDSVNH